ncbi:MAG TPA: hypothetical protein VGS10_21340 [Terracidiphilus sp.]|nr:hypothetical protein [Terracidiphilus sp.]
MMERLLGKWRIGPTHASVVRRGEKLRLVAIGAALGAMLAGPAAWCQVITIDTNGKGPIANGPVSREYQQIEPTKVQLNQRPLDPKTKLLLVRCLESEQGFAMRPLPRGHKGITLEANGKLNPAGEAYLNMATQNGISAKPGDRVVITNVKIDHNKIILDLNGGPDAKHRFLSHIQIGMGDPNYGDPTQPIVQSGEAPVGARLTLAFHGDVPELTGDDVESLLAPLISFKVQTPIEAYTATLPPALKNAIVNHEVWVGMNDQMVLFAKGRPENKYRETDDNMPVTIWMYGKPPQEVDFVRFNGNRVIKVEIARVGQPLEVFTKDEVTPLLTGSHTSLASVEKVHPVQEGDVQRDPNTQAPAPPPTLGAPTDKFPQNNPNQRGQEGPVYFPPDTQDSGNTQGSQPSSQPKNQPSAQTGTQEASQPPTSSQPSTPLGQNPDEQAPAQAPSGTSKQYQPGSGQQ